MMRRGPKESVELKGAIKRGLERGMTVAALADLLDVSTQTIYYHRSRLKGDANGKQSGAASPSRTRKVRGRG